MNEPFKSFVSGAILVAAWVIVLTLPPILLMLYDIRTLLK